MKSLFSVQQLQSFPVNGHTYGSYLNKLICNRHVDPCQCVSLKLMTAQMCKSADLTMLKKCKSLWKILCLVLIDKFRTIEYSCTDRHRLLRKALLTFSGVHNIFCWTRGLCWIDPVSSHRHTHWLIIFHDGTTPRCQLSQKFRQNPHWAVTIDLICTLLHRKCTSVPWLSKSKTSLML